MTPQTQPNQSYEALQKRQKKMQKQIILIFCGILFLLLLVAGAVLLLQNLTKPEPPTYDYEFYPTYEGNILEYEPYLRLDRQIHYCPDRDGYGLTTPIDDELYKTLDPAAQLAYQFLGSIIAGDHTLYNSFFDDGYLKKQGAQEPFSPQMLYDMTLYAYSYVAGEGNVRTYTYRLDYKFFQNDGTYRRDVGSDSVRSQFLTVEVSPDGTAKIVAMALYHVTGNVDLD
ncbi:MAG: hypothetical protein IKC31_06440 [Clostridia bacterium]|nr:hypothetical protein [Clostridia bacterium]